MMRRAVVLAGLFLLTIILFTGCVKVSPGEVPTPSLTSPGPATIPVTTPPTSSMGVSRMPLVTPGLGDLVIRASPERYVPLMSSTVGIGLTPNYSGPGPVIYSWNASYGHFITWNAPDWKVKEFNNSIDTTDPTIYWSYSPDDMGKEKPPVTIRLVVKTPPRVHGGNGTIAWKEIHITWENTDTAVIAPGY